MSTDNRYIKIVNDYRAPEDNEFFFSQDPHIYGMKKLFDYLEVEHGIQIEKIPGWQLKSEVKSAYDNQYLTIHCGLRVNKLVYNDT